MATYVYRDDETGFEKEVVHSMAEVDNPSEATIAETTHEGRRMHRVPQLSNVAGMSLMTADQKKTMLKKRATQHHHKSGDAEKKRDMLKGL